MNGMKGEVIMKRIIAVCMALVLVLTAFPVSALAVETKAQKKEEIFVGYEEFRDNEAHYWNQVKTQRKRVYIYVGEKYKEEVESIFSSSIIKDNELAENNQSRGLEIPGHVWDVSVKGTYTTGYASTSIRPIYSNYRVSGITNYAVQVFNPAENVDSVVKIHGGPFAYGGNDITVYAGFAMLDLLITEDELDEFYFEFTAPCSRCWARAGDYDELAYS